MGKKFFVCKFILLFTTTLLLFSCGSSDKHSISGSVVDSSGVGIPEVTVTMGELTTTTDSSGRYKFSDISEGFITITPSLQGAVLSPNSITLYIEKDISKNTTFIVSWLPVNSSVTSSDLFGISYVNDTYFSTGASGTILTSQDGKTWTTVTSNTTSELYGVAFGNSRYVAVGTGGTMLISTDGVTWSVLSSFTDENIYDILYESTVGTFVAVGSNGIILVSMDGVTWTPLTPITTAHIYRIASLNSTFYAVGSGGTIITSSDGTTWNMLNSGTTNDLYGICFGSSSYLAAGAAGTVLTSPNGTEWSFMNIGVSNILTDVAFGGTNFVATGTGFGNIFISSDGLTWSAKITDGSTNPSQMNRIVYGNEAFVAVGDSGAIYWTSVP